jgi:hypothetical protein
MKEEEKDNGPRLISIGTFSGLKHQPAGNEKVVHPW